MSGLEAAVWIVGIVVGGFTLASVVGSLSEAATKIKGIKNDSEIFAERIKEERNELEDGTEER